MLKKSLLFSIVLCCCGYASANQQVAVRYIDNANLVGEARLKVMFWNVFDARLYATDGRYDQARPFALSLSYLRNLKGKDIVDKTVEEMAAQTDKNYTREELDRWSLQLSTIIQDVDNKTTITGVRDQNGFALFYRNGNPIGEIKDPRFTAGFFDIWLGESSSNQRLRSQLLNQS